MDAFYEARGEGWFRSTGHTRGPWSPQHQHFGAPAGLLGRACASADGGEGKRVARITFEILQPVPIADLHVEVTVARPGRRVDLVEARLTDAAGTVLVLVRCWRMRRGSVELPASASRDDVDEAMPGPERAEQKSYFLDDDLPGFHHAVSWAFVDGGFLEPGPARAWGRMHVQVVAGEEPTPLERLLVAADTGNGLSAHATIEELLYLNTELTVHLHRDPVGPWIGLDAHSVLEPTGTGLATSVLHDRAGPIGRASQALFVDLPR